MASEFHDDKDVMPRVTDDSAVHATFLRTEVNLMKKLNSLRTLFLIPVLASGLMLTTGCQEKGPAEKAGENIDKAASNAADALNPKGPLEKAGEKVDNAVGK